MPKGAKKRKAEKKKKEQLGNTGTDHTTYHGNGEGKEEVGVAGGMDESDRRRSLAGSAPVEVDVKGSPSSSDGGYHSGAEVEVARKGKEVKCGSGSSDSSSDSSSDEELPAVDVPVPDPSPVSAPADEKSDVGVGDGRVHDVGIEASPGLSVDRIEEKVDSFVNENSSGRVVPVLEEVLVVEAAPPVVESDLVVECVVAKTAPSSETLVEVVGHEEVEIRKTRENQELLGSAPLPVRPTSWKGCCGLFELFGGAK